MPSIKRCMGLFYAGILLTALLPGCSGMEPYNPPDYRNEGTGKGLFSGEDGEFIIFQKGEPARTDGDSAESKQKETTD